MSGHVMSPGTGAFRVEKDRERVGLQVGEIWDSPDADHLSDTAIALMRNRCGIETEIR